MGQTIAGIVIICMGIALVLFRKEFVDEVIKLNNEGMGFYRYGGKEKKLGLWSVPLGGALAIVIGILVLFGIFDLK